MRKKKLELLYEKTKRILTEVNEVEWLINDASSGIGSRANKAWVDIHILMKGIKKEIEREEINNQKIKTDGGNQSNA